MYCKYCGKELDDNSKFCIGCGKPTGNINAASSTENNDVESAYDVNSTAAVPEEEFSTEAGIEKNGELLKPKFQLKKSVVIAGISIAAVIVVLLGGWFFSGGILISMSNSAIEANNLDKAESCLKYSCPIGFKNDEINDLKIKISAARNALKTGQECLEVNDYVGAINASYVAVDALDNYGEAQQFYEEAVDSFYQWMNDLYQRGKYSEAAHGFAQLGLLAAADTENEKLNELRELFNKKSNEFLTSAQNYYNNFEPDKASENVDIVLAIDSENTEAQDLKAKIDSYNENKVNIDEAQEYYDNKDYSNALTSFDKADDYTKNVHKELRSQIETAKQNQEIDDKYASYVGEYSDPTLDLGSDEITITKIEDGKIWLEGYYAGDDFWLSYSVSGASIASGTVSVTSQGSCIDYDAILNDYAPPDTTKNITGSETITLKNGRIYHTNSSNGDNYYLRTTTYELYKK